MLHVKYNWEHEGDNDTLKYTTVLGGWNWLILAWPDIGQSHRQQFLADGCGKIGSCS